MFHVCKHRCHEGIVLPTSLQFLNSMPAIMLLFSLLNIDQIWEQCQPVSELLTSQVHIPIVSQNMSIGYGIVQNY